MRRSRREQESECALGWDGELPRSKKLNFGKQNPVGFQNKIHSVLMVRLTKT